MRASDFSRDDCLVGKRRRSYDKLEREYVCADCGGRLGSYYAGGEDYDGECWAIHCGRCHSTRFIHERKQARQRADAAEVLDGLPPELAAQLK